MRSTDCGVPVYLPATVFNRRATAADVQEPRGYLLEIPADTQEIAANIGAIRIATRRTAAAGE